MITRWFPVAILLFQMSARAQATVQCPEGQRFKIDASALQLRFEQRSITFTVRSSLVNLGVSADPKTLQTASDLTQRWNQLLIGLAESYNSCAITTNQYHRIFDDIVTSTFSTGQQLRAKTDALDRGERVRREEIDAIVGRLVPLLKQFEKGLQNGFGTIEREISVLRGGLDRTESKVDLVSKQIEYLADQVATLAVTQGRDEVVRDFELAVKLIKDGKAASAVPLLKKAVNVIPSDIVLQALGSVSLLTPIGQDVLSINWVQTSVEYRQVCEQTWNAALSSLTNAIRDRDWPLAYGAGNGAGAPAILLNIDDTILDNSPFQASSAQQNLGYSQERWETWVTNSSAGAVPGAIRFVSAVKKLGVKVFYITNRTLAQREATERNLGRLGFPIEDDKTVAVLYRQASSRRESRISLLASRYRLLMSIGSDLSHFVDIQSAGLEERRAVFDLHRDKWGKNWIMFPNPMYGSWEVALYERGELPAVSRRKALKTQ